MSFYGSAAEDELKRPRLFLTVRGSGPTVPQPSPAFPRGKPSTIVDGGTSFVEVTCDGGASASVSCGRAFACKILSSVCDGRCITCSLGCAVNVLRS
jgi:hypothetical protein